MPTLFQDVIETVTDSTTVSFNDTGTKPAVSIVWGMDTLDGWHESADLDVVSSDIGGGWDGEILGDIFPAKGRHFLASGFATSASRADADTLIDLILGDAFPVNKEIQLIRFEPIPKYVWVKVSGQKIIQRVGPRDFRWIVPLVSGSPYKFDYSPPSDSSGTSGVAGLSSGGRSYPRTYPMSYTTGIGGDEASVTVVNRGTVGTHPVISVTGPLNKGAWRIENDTTGEFIKFDIALALGDTLVIDFDAGTALLNGYPVTATITGTFWRVEKGPNKIKLYGDYDPAAGFTISIESAWE